MKAWTDYPFVELGDTAGQEAPVRPCEVLSYDADKYVVVRVEGKIFHIKAGYVYTKPGRSGTVAPLSQRQLMVLPKTD